MDRKPYSDATICCHTGEEQPAADPEETVPVSRAELAALRDVLAELISEINDIMLR